MIKQFLYSLFFLLAIDGVWLFLNKNFYSQQIGHLMASNPKLVFAIFFYPLYALGIAWFAVNSDGDLVKAFLSGAFLGLIAYATYDLTNQITLKDWPVLVTVVDIAWGALLTGVVAFLTTKFI